jgi:molybdopterin-guanine dinucleotide biosynthesis protein
MPGRGATAIKMRFNSELILVSGNPRSGVPETTDLKLNYCIIEGLNTMNLSKQIIHKQVEHLVKENYLDEEIGKARSKAYNSNGASLSL